MLNGCIVHGEKGQRLRIKDPHRLWIVLKQNAVLMFGTTERPLDVLCGVVWDYDGTVEVITNTSAVSLGSDRFPIRIFCDYVVDAHPASPSSWSFRSGWIASNGARQKV